MHCLGYLQSTFFKSVGYCSLIRSFSEVKGGEFKHKKTEINRLFVLFW